MTRVPQIESAPGKWVELGGVLPPSVQRVLEAARAWRKGLAIEESMFVSNGSPELRVAIDALDAPRERYYTQGSHIRERIDDSAAGWNAFAQASCPEYAEQIAAALNIAALNAQERKP